MSDKTPVAMPTPYGQAMYGMQKNIEASIDQLETIVELIRPTPTVDLKKLLEERLSPSEPIQKEFDWERYFQGLIPKEKVEVRKSAPIKGAQVGGDHYQKSELQPWDIFLAWGLDPWTANVVKYSLRYPYKNGKEDLLKARHYLDYLIEHYDEVKQKYYKKD